MDKIPKRIGNLYEKLISWENLYLAYKKACKRKKGKQETSEWMFHCEERLIHLQNELKTESYQPEAYKYFTITKPKERVISVASFRDRVVHHALINVIEPVFESMFIKDSYATRKEKGLHKAVLAAQNYVRKYEWYLKLDIGSYFANINHQILIDLLERKIKDKSILKLCRIILETQTHSTGNTLGVGIPIGNLTSQFFANVYLNKLDFMIKQEMHYHGYVRYMDDFILFSNSKEELKKELPNIRERLLHELALSLNENVIQINKGSKGLPFLGYRIYPNLIRVRTANLKRCLKGIRAKEKEYLQGEIDAEALKMSTQSRVAFINFANSKNLCLKLWGKNQKAGLTV